MFGGLICVLNSVLLRPVELFGFDLVDLRELDLDRGGAAEDADHDLEGLLVLVDVVDGPVKLANGPSLMRTCSFFSNLTFMVGLLVAESERKRMELTSCSERATGLSPVPRKPVTRGVFLMTCQRSLSSSISTRT